MGFRHPCLLYIDEDHYTEIKSGSFEAVIYSCGFLWSRAGEESRHRF